MYRYDVSLPRTSTLGSALLAAIAIWITSAAAATAQVPADSVPRYNLDSISVSVLGGSVEVGRSAYPISVAGRKELREGKTGMYLEEALQSLPGVQVQNRFNYAVGERVVVRGFGSRAQFGVRGVHVEIDGIPATLPDGQSTIDHLDIASLGRVEALRGPASALYGNASGGVLRFQSQIPSQSPLRSEATIMGGSDGLLRMQSSNSGTVGSTGYLVDVNRLSYDGYRNVPMGGGSYGKADRFHINGRMVQDLAGGEMGLTFNYLDLDAENPGSLSQSLFDSDPTTVHPFYTRFQTGKEVQQTQIGLTWNGPVGGLTAEAAVYGVSRDFFNPLPFDVADVDRRAGGARVVLGHEAESGSTAFALRVGTEFDYQNDDRREYANDDGVLGDLGVNQTERVRSTGVFAQASATVAERVSFLGGLRYDHTAFAVDDLFPVDSTNADDSGSRDMNKVSPTVGVHVEVTPELGLFSNFSTGFETPTTTELGNRETGAGGFNPDLDPQTSKTFEAGARGALQGRFAYEVTFFRTNLENELITYEIVSAPGINYFRNAGKSHRTGFEASLSASLHEMVSAQASYAYTDARYDDFTPDSINYGMSCPGASSPGESCRVPGLAPEQLQGSVRLGPEAWFVELGAEWTDEIPVNDDNTGRFAEAYTLFDVRVGANAVRFGRLDFSPFAGVRNVFDETYVSSVTINAPGTRYYEPGPGRTFYVGGTLAAAR